jgi:hypothetical protein
MAIPEHTFVAYIDEAGDEGFRFEHGSSEWFILSAAIVKKDRDNDLIQMVRGTHKDFNKPADYVLHFRKLKHNQRLEWIGRIAASVCTITSIVVHKPSLDSAIFQAKSALYNYATRLLIERISWLCRDNGGGQVRMFFSNKANLSYQELCEYIDRRLRSDVTVKMHWPIIDTRLIEPQNPRNRICLQIADGVASSYFVALEYTAFGFTECRFAEMLKPVVYCRGNNYRSYGLKFFPSVPTEQAGKRSRLEWVYQ